MEKEHTDCKTIPESKLNKTSNIVEMLMENYISLEASIAEQLSFSVTHQAAIGTYRETVWKNLFEQIVPKKFSIEQSVFIIDSYRSVSREIDLAIFDEQYTPYIFQFGRLKFIPIEAVAVVIQCKSNTLCKADLEAWSSSIHRLKTRMKSITRVISGISVMDDDKNAEKVKRAQTSTRPVQMLCHIADKTPEGIKELFDFVLSRQGRGLHLYTNTERKLSDWYYLLNHHGTEKAEVQKDQRENNESGIIEYGEKLYNPTLKEYRVTYQVRQPDDSNNSDNTTKEKENTILSLIFELNQLLMIINNPIMFPHLAYVDMFNSAGINLEENIEKADI